MNSIYLKSLIAYTNCKFYGVDLKSMYLESGKKIADKILTRYGKDKNYVIVCGMSGNAGDGFSTALHMIKQGAVNMEIYLIGRQNHIEDPIALELFHELNNLVNDMKSNSIFIKQDCYAKDIPQKDILIEALVGTGLEGNKLNKRYHDLISRISHFSSKTIAIDVPAPSYTPDETYSLMYPKTENAEIIELSSSKDISLLCGPGEVKYLFSPKKQTHKLKNGKLLYVVSTSDIKNLTSLIGIAKQYEVYCYIYNFNKDNSEIENLGGKNWELITDSQLEDVIDSVDNILYGKVDEISLLSKSLITEITKFSKNKVINGNIAEFIDLDKVNTKDVESVMIVNKEISNKIPTLKEGNLKRFSQQNNIDIVNVGLQIVMYNAKGDLKIQQSQLAFNENYKDILSFLCSVLLTKNDSWITVRASAFIIELSYKLAVDAGKKNLIDAIDYISEAIEWCRFF